MRFTALGQILAPHTIWKLSLFNSTASARQFAALRTLILPASILLLAFALVLPRLGVRSLWVDESLAWEFSRAPLDQTFQQVIHDVHPPLYFLLMHVWLRLIGDSVFAMRFLSTLMHVLALAVIFRLSYRWTRHTGVAALTVLLCGLSLFAVAWARNARMYSLLLLASAVCIERYLVWSRQGDDASGAMLRRLTFAASIALALFTHYYAALLVVALAVHFLLVGQFRWRRWEQMAGVLALGGLPFLLWLRPFMYQFVFSGGGNLTHALDTTPDALVHVLDVLFSQAILPYSVLCLFACVVLWYRLPRRDALLILLLGPGVLLLAFALNTRIHTFVERNVIFALIPFMLLVAWGLYFLPRPLRPMAVLLLSLLTIASHQTFAPEHDRYPWDRLITDMQPAVQPDDVFLVAALDIWSFDYYRQRLLPASQPGVYLYDEPDITHRQSEHPDLSAAQRVWLMTVIDFPQPPGLDGLLSAFTPATSFTVEGLHAQLYLRSP